MYDFSKMRFRLSQSLRLLAALFVFATSAHSFAESAGAGSGGRGGPFFEFHFSPLSVFDGDVTGNPIVLGGEGFGFASKSFRLGGGGGGGFVWNPSENVQFGMGFGGVIGEYMVTPWLNVRLLIGGGGYAISKTIVETDTTRTEQKISSGAFLLFHPSIGAEVSVSTFMKLSARIGYFLPNVSRLQSVTLGIHLIFGKS